MAVKTVTGKLTDLSGNAIPYPRVRATLSAPAVIAATQEVAPTTLKVIGAADGTWTMLAQANADLIPANTSYNWEVGEAWSASVIVPQTAGPFKIEDIMAPPPPLGAAWDAILMHLAGSEIVTGVKSGKWLDTGGMAFNANAYAGVDPTGVADSTTGLQTFFAAAIAASGRAVLPGAYKVTGTITLQPSAGTQFHMDMEGIGTFSAITWAGADSSALFQTFGWNQSAIRNVKINISPGNSTVAGWDVDVKTGATSSSGLSFYDCGVNMQVGSGTGNIGWRIGHTGGLIGQLSGLAWSGCGVTGNDTTKNHIGWVNEHSNGVSYNWFASGGSGLLKMVTNVSTAGAASAQGGGYLFFYGCGASGNLTDYEFTTANSLYGIYGGRYELGKVFLAVPFNQAAPTIMVSGVEITAYTPANNIVFDIQGACNLTLDSCQALSGPYTVDFIRFSNNPVSRNSLTLRGFQIHGVDPCWNFFGRGTPVTDSAIVENCTLIDGSGRATAYMQPHAGALTQTWNPTYGATVTCDLTRGKRQKVTVTNGSAFNFAAIAGAYDGQEVIIEIFNNTGGAIANPTFDASFLLAGGTAFVSPGLAKRRVIAFGWTGSPLSKFIELYRTTADT